MPHGFLYFSPNVFFFFVTQTTQHLLHGSRGFTPPSDTFFRRCKLKGCFNYLLLRILKSRLYQVLSQYSWSAKIAVDVGNNTYSFGRYFEAKNQRILMLGYLGSIGFAFPAAMGAWAANTGRPILSVSGDGGFCQYLAEFTTAVKYQMNITHLLLNNSELGKISKEQRAGEWPVWQTSLHNPNFAEYAQNCGGHGVRVNNASELDNALAAAIAHDGPAIVEVMSDAELI